MTISGSTVVNAALAEAPAAKPHPQGVRRNGQVGFGQVEGLGHAHRVVGPVVNGWAAQRPGDLLGGHDLGRDRLGELPGTPAHLRVIPPGAAGPGEPLVLGVRDDDLSVGELDLVAGPSVHRLGGRHDRHQATVRPEQLLPDSDLPHGRPPGRRRQRGIQRQRLADGRSSCDNDHLAGVQAIGERVEVIEPGRDAGHHAAARADRLDLVERAGHDVRQRQVVLADPALGDTVDLGLGAVHQLVGVAIAGVPELHDPGARLHQTAQDRPLPDDPCVVPGVGRGRHRGEQRVQVGTPTDARQFAALGQQVADGHRVRGLAPAVQLQDRLVHELVGGPVVVEGTDHLHDVGDGILGHQHSAEDALLGGQIVRRGALELPASGGEFGDAHDHPPPRLADAWKSPATVLHIRCSDRFGQSSAARGLRPIALCTGLWTACADTPLSLCAGWG